jgi:hypothetical protein
MNELNFKPATEALGDKQIAVPANDQGTAMHGQQTRLSRRRFSVTRLLAPTDDGFRPFRVY